MWIAIMIVVVGVAIAGEIALRQSPKAHAADAPIDVRGIVRMLAEIRNRK